VSGGALFVGVPVGVLWHLKTTLAQNGIESLA